MRFAVEHFLQAVEQQAAVGQSRQRIKTCQPQGACLGGLDRRNVAELADEIEHRAVGMAHDAQGAPLVIMLAGAPATDNLALPAPGLFGQFPALADTGTARRRDTAEIRCQPQHFTRGVAGNGLESRIDAQDAVTGIGNEHRFAAVFEYLRRQHQLALGPPQAGDILHRSGYVMPLSDNLQGTGRKRQPPPHTVRRDQYGVKVDFMRRHGMRVAESLQKTPGLFERRLVKLRHHLGQRHLLPVCGNVQELARLLRQVKHIGVDVQHPATDLSGTLGLLEQQCLAGVVGHVAQDAHRANNLTFGIAVRVKGRFQTAHTAAGQRQPGLHAQVPARQRPLNPLHQFAPVGVGRQQLFQLPAAHFLHPDGQQVAQGRAGKSDQSFRINERHGVGTGCHDAFKPALCLFGTQLP